MKLLLKGHGVRIPFPETPGVKLRIVFFDTDEGRKQPRTNIIVLFGYRAVPEQARRKEELRSYMMKPVSGLASITTPSVDLLYN